MADTPVAPSVTTNSESNPTNTAQTQAATNQTPRTRPIMRNVFRGSEQSTQAAEQARVNTADNTPQQPIEPQTQPQEPAGGQTTTQPNQPTQPSAPSNQQEFPEDYYYDDYPELFPGVVKPVAEELIYEWQAPSRPFKQHNRQYYTTIGTIVLLICLILFFAGQFLPIAVVIAVAFLSYILSSIPPHTITNQITSYGVRIENQLYFWEELGRFWLKKKFDDELIYIESSRFPNRLMLLIGNEDKELLRSIFSEVLLEQEPPPTAFERAAAWLQRKIPLDIES